MKRVVRSPRLAADWCGRPDSEWQSQPVPTDRACSHHTEAFTATTI